MRKPRDFDLELKALADKARQLKERRVRQLGELVAATGADALGADLLAGALLDAVASADASTREGWRKAGAAFFCQKRRSVGRGSEGGARSNSPDPRGALPFGGADRAS